MKIMQLTYINNNQNKLLIFFCGFYTDENCFKDFDHKTHDILHVYDYSTIDYDIFDDFDFSPYTEIDLIAYSYGVWATGVMNLARALPKIDRSLAICGTFKPIDDVYGVPSKIYDIMLKNLNTSTLSTFESKMFQGAEIKKSARTIENLREELENIKEMSAMKTHFDFDSVICAKNDRIIPFSSQENHWATHPNKKILNTGHFPFYEFGGFEEMLAI